VGSGKHLADDNHSAHVRRRRDYRRRHPEVNGADEADAKHHAGCDNSQITRKIVANDEEKEKHADDHHSRYKQTRYLGHRQSNNRTPEECAVDDKLVDSS